MKEKEVEKSSFSYKHCVKKTDKKYKELSFEQMQELGDTVLPKKYATAQKGEKRHDQFMMLGNSVCYAVSGLFMGMLNPAELGYRFDFYNTFYNHSMADIDFYGICSALADTVLTASIGGSLAYSIFSVYKSNQVQNLLCDSVNYCKLLEQKQGKEISQDELAKYTPYINPLLKKYRMKRSMHRLQDKFRGFTASDMQLFKEDYLEQNVGKMFQCNNDARDAYYKAIKVGAMGFGLKFGLDVLSLPFYNMMYGLPHEADTAALGMLGLIAVGVFEPFIPAGLYSGKKANKRRREAEAFLDVMAEKQKNESNATSGSTCDIEFRRL